MEAKELDRLKLEMTKSIRQFGESDFPDDDVFDIEKWKEKISQLNEESFKVLFDEIKDFTVNENFKAGARVLDDVFEYNDNLSNDYTKEVCDELDVILGRRQVNTGLFELQSL